MNKEKIATQRLADIKALLDYVKEGIDSIVSKEKADQLDSMGKASITMLKALNDIQDGIKESEEKLLKLHSEITEETFKNLEEPLEKLLRDIKDNTINQEEFLEAIVESYESYEVSIDQLEKTIKESESSEKEVYKSIDQKISGIVQEVENIEQLIPKDIAYQASLKEINNSIDRMVESERLNNDRHKETLDKVGKELTESQELLTQTNDVLVNIAETYEKSTGRLHVLDVKLDTLSNILLENIEGETIGGIDSE